MRDPSRACDPVWWPACWLTGGLRDGPRWRKRRAPPPVDVDLELVLAVDVSYSMDPDNRRCNAKDISSGSRHPGSPRSRRAWAHCDHVFRVGRHRRPEGRGAVAGHRRTRDRPGLHG